MKAVMRADFYLARQDIKTMVIGCALLGFVACLIADPLPQLACFCGIIVAVPVYTRLAQNDEKGPWETFRLTLPLSRSRIIAGRYATAALLAVIGIVVGALVCLTGAGVDQIFPSLASAMRHPQVFNVPEMALYMAAGFAIVVTILSIMLPIVAKWGMQQTMVLIPALLTCTAFFAMQIILPYAGKAGLAPLAASLASQIGASPQPFQGTFLIVGILVLAALVLYVVSAMIATAVYRRRDF